MIKKLLVNLAVSRVGTALASGGGVYVATHWPTVHDAVCAASTVAAGL